MNENEKSPLWGGGFSASPAEAFERLNASIPFDARLAPYDIQGSIAHAAMLGEREIVTPDESAELVRGLEVVLVEVEAGSFSWTPGGQDVPTPLGPGPQKGVGDAPLQPATGARPHRP